MQRHIWWSGPMILCALGIVGCGPSVVRPPAAGPRPFAARPPTSLPPMTIQPRATVRNPWQPDKPARDWRHVVIHHTASSRDSVDSIHEAHLKRGWEGVGYHFVIGNGNGMADGEIEATFRWKTQMHGAHAGSEEYNQHGIGICLVGNFEETHPSAAQLTSVKRLVGVLKSEYGIQSDHIIGHRNVKSTACPGKHFPMAEVSQSEDLPFLAEITPAPVSQVVVVERRTSR